MLVRLKLNMNLIHTHSRTFQFNSCRLGGGSPENLIQQVGNKTSHKETMLSHAQWNKNRIKRQKSIDFWEFSVSKGIQSSLEFYSLLKLVWGGMSKLPPMPLSFYKEDVMAQSQDSKLVVISLKASLHLSCWVLLEGSFDSFLYGIHQM